jgi:hypothetical protein
MILLQQRNRIQIFGFGHYSNSQLYFTGGNQRRLADVPAVMRHETVTISAAKGVDWKALGYLISIASVFFLGAVAWPGPDEPKWHMAVLIIGMATSIIGMGCRYKSHLDEKREIRRAEAKAERR